MYACLGSADMRRCGCRRSGAKQRLNEASRAWPRELPRKFQANHHGSCGWEGSAKGQSQIGSAAAQWWLRMQPDSYAGPSFQGCDGAESSCNPDVVESTQLPRARRKPRFGAGEERKRRLSKWVCHVWEGRQIRFEIQIQIQIEGVGCVRSGGRERESGRGRGRHTRRAGGWQVREVGEGQRSGQR